MHSAWLGFLKGSAHINCNSDQVWVSRWLHQTWHLLLLTSHMWCLQAKLEPRFTCEHCRKLAATTQAKKNTWWEIIGHGTCRSRSVTVGHGWSRSLGAMKLNMNPRVFRLGLNPQQLDQPWLSDTMAFAIQPMPQAHAHRKSHIQHAPDCSP